MVSQEPEWDVSSAFVANAASHIKLKGLKTRTLQISRENKENEARSSQVHKQTLVLTHSLTEEYAAVPPIHPVSNHCITTVNNGNVILQHV